jgi:hypothetical protein
MLWPVKCEGSDYSKPMVELLNFEMYEKYFVTFFEYYNTVIN